MPKNTQEDSVLKELEQNFNNKISDLTVTTVKNSNELIPLNNIHSLQAQVKGEIQVDVKELSQVASDLIEKNEKLSDQEVAIELLKNIASNSKSKIMRKLASNMIKEKWWNKK
ncbi:hypothetical protein V7112_05220 [Bacillus sp. JJ1566]|uniref:hypothetical protein n=1 Tax=Bacillus sp. JJ1566 TaxID=3122961 RepID=UPI002FFD9744